VLREFERLTGLPTRVEVNVHPSAWLLMRWCKKRFTTRNRGASVEFAHMPSAKKTYPTMAQALVEAGLGKFCKPGCTYGDIMAGRVPSVVSVSLASGAARVAGPSPQSGLGYSQVPSRKTSDDFSIGMNGIQDPGVELRADAPAFIPASLCLSGPNIPAGNRAQGHTSFCELPLFVASRVPR